MNMEELKKKALYITIYDAVHAFPEGFKVSEIYDAIVPKVTKDFIDGVVQEMVDEKVIVNKDGVLTRGICPTCGEECWRNDEPPKEEWN